jgi:hypothetical protein
VSIDLTVDNGECGLRGLLPVWTMVVFSRWNSVEEEALEPHFLLYSYSLLPPINKGTFYPSILGFASKALRDGIYHLSLLTP